MPRLTITIDDEQADLLEEKTGEGGEYESKSEAVRNFIRGYEELSERVDELENENARLERQLTAANNRYKEHTELVKYVEDELSYRDAGLATRAKWWLFGRDRGD